MDTRDQDRKWWRLLLGLVLGAFLGSVWAALAGPGCGSCDGLHAAFGGRALALAGLAFYAAIAVAGLLRGPSLFVFTGVQIAAAVHGSLLALMFQRGIFCAPCLVTGGAAVAALGVSIRVDPANAFRAGFVLPGVVFALQSWMIFSGPAEAGHEARGAAREAVRGELASPPEPAGRVRMVAFVRPDCGYCRELEDAVLPALRQEFGGRISIERRSAEGIPGLPTPTIILLGQDGRKVFPGLPPREELVRAIQGLMGESHGREAVLPEPR
jgi:thiol-disulfide isomerase/thioredoxin